MGIQNRSDGQPNTPPLPSLCSDGQQPLWGGVKQGVVVSMTREKGLNDRGGFILSSVGDRREKEATTNN